MPPSTRSSRKRKRRSTPKATVIPVQADGTTVDNAPIDVSNPFPVLPPPTWDATPCTTEPIADPVEEAILSVVNLYVPDPFENLPRDHPFSQALPGPSKSTFSTQQALFLRQHDLPDSHSLEHSCFCRFAYCPFHN